nr:hypothetical protein [Pseudomonas syringae]
MTTIAYKDGVIAYDSRTTGGTTISDDDSGKLQTSTVFSSSARAVPAISMR